MPKTVDAKFIFLDVVGFSSREIELQASIVSRLNYCVEKAVVSILGNKEGASYIPTGDGMCIWIDGGAIKPAEGVESYEVDVRIALAVLGELKKRKGEEVDFSVRIGINENEDIQVIDINHQKNIAGRGINFASRVMDQADSGQILLSPRVHDRLCQRLRYVGCFRSHRVVFKHGLEYLVYQLVGINDSSVDCSMLEIGEPKEVKRLRQSRENGRQIITEGLRMDAYRQCLMNATGTILIVTQSRDWIYPLAPSLVIARHRGVRILVSYYPDSQDDMNRGELRYLRAIGAIVIEQPPRDKVPFSGFLVDFHSNTRISGIVQTANCKNTPIFGQRLESSADEELLLCLREVALGRLLNSSSNRDFAALLMATQSLKVNVGTDEASLNLMSNVKYYRNRGCSFRIESVRVDEVFPQAEDVRTFKFRQACDIIRFIEKINGNNLFELLNVLLASGGICPMLPPVVECHDSRYIVAEGHNRLYALHKRDSKAVVKVIVVSGELPCPAAHSRRWASLREDDERVGTALPTERSDRNESRNIESDVHRGLWPGVTQDPNGNKQDTALNAALNEVFSS